VCLSGSREWTDLEVGMHHVVAQVDVPVVHELPALSVVVLQLPQGPPLAYL